LRTLDRDTREMRELLDPALLLGRGGRRLARIDCERAQHASFRRLDGRRPAGTQAVHGRQTSDPVGPALVSREVQRDDLLAKMRRRGARTDAQADRRPIERGRVAGWEARTRAVTKLLPFAVEQKEGGQQARVDLLGKAAYRVERRGERTP